MDDNLNNNDLTSPKKKRWFFKWWGIIIIIVIILIIIYLVYFSFLIYNEYQAIRIGKFSSPSSLEKFLQKQKTYDQSDKRLDFSDDPYLGNLQAKVKIIEFGDFQCPYCRESFPVVRNIANDYNNQILIVYRDFPLSAIHPQAQIAAEAADCAFDQGKFWEYHDKLFINQENLTANDLLKYATELNLDLPQFQQCLNNNKKTAAVQKDYQDGQSLGIKGTPTFFINGVMFAGSLPENLFKEIINYFLEINN